MSRNDFVDGLALAQRAAQKTGIDVADMLTAIDCICASAVAEIETKRLFNIPTIGRITLWRCAAPNGACMAKLTFSAFARFKKLLPQNTFVQFKADDAFIAGAKRHFFDVDE